MSTSYEAYGLTADWLNGWLAAIGATVLVPKLRLRWSQSPTLIAIFEHDDIDDIPKAISDSLPSPESLELSPISKESSECKFSFGRQVTLEVYQERAVIERKIKSGYLAASVSDLDKDAEKGSLIHGLFDVSGPGTIGTLWERAYACAKEIPADDRERYVRDSLDGHGQLVNRTGLGFDPRRLPTSVHSKSDLKVDPVIELLAFSALEIFPTRGDGKEILQRRWTSTTAARGVFRWEAWKPPLDRWAIDAFLDLRELDRTLVIDRFQVVPYKRRGDERNCAYFAEQVPDV